MPPKFKRTVSHEDLLKANDTETTGLLGESEDDGDFFLKGPSGVKGIRYENGKLIEVREQVKEVQEIMRENIQRVLERGDQLDELQDRSESLSIHADTFSSTAKALQKAMWWRNTKMKLILAAIILLVLIVIIVPIILHTNK